MHHTKIKIRRNMYYFNQCTNMSADTEFHVVSQYVAVMMASNREFTPFKEFVADILDELQVYVNNNCLKMQIGGSIFIALQQLEKP